MTRHDPNRADHILAVIEDFTLEYGYAPSVREIGERVGLASTSAVHHWLVKLRKDGRLGGDPGHARAYVAPRTGPPPLTVEALELAWCESVHGSKPPRMRPCKRHRLMCEWLVEVVIPKARAAA